MEDQEDRKELQLLPSPFTASSSSHVKSWPSNSSRTKLRSTLSETSFDRSTVDLQLSISLRPIRPSFDGARSSNGGAEALKWQAAEQIRLAAMEKAYAERVRDLTRREMELAQSEFARARHMWERAREEVEKAERMKERATRQVDSTCMEITCQACRQRFRP